MLVNECTHKSKTVPNEVMGTEEIIMLVRNKMDGS